MNRAGDIALAIVVLAIIAMLLVPLPTAAIDGLIVLNISISLLLLLVGLYMPSSLSLLSFPTLLLLTTLFRLALNVASSRLILSQGDAGVVIHAFGTFLIRGELFVGLVIFTIVTIVNFLVIAKGASRVSEVAARFVLDALPGKQASIDLDLRAGLIGAEQAKTKRDELRKESQLFGAMDGAMKFVQGDAIAGILIIFVNILGGLYMGLSSGMELGAAAQTYTILTVGDGLVSQIPALLISICAGIVVTRVSSNDGLTLGKDLFGQLLANPQAVFVTGLLLTVIGFLPGIPFLPFFLVGGAFLGAGWYWRSSKVLITTTGENYLLPAPIKRADVGVLTHSEIEEVKLSAPIILEIGDHANQLIHGTSQLLRFWSEIQRGAKEELGLSLPDIFVRQSNALAPMQISASWQEDTIFSSQFLADVILIPIHPTHAKVLGFTVTGVAEHPLFGSLLAQCPLGPESRRLTEACGVSSYDSLQVTLLHVARFFFDAPETIVTLGVVYQELKHLEKSGQFRAESVGNYFLSPAKITQVLTVFVRERISIKDLSGILEAIAEFCASHRVTLQDDTDVSLPVLVDFIRAKRCRSLRARVMNYGKHLVAIGIAPALEAIIKRGELDHFFHTLYLSSSVDETVRQQLKNSISLLREYGAVSLVVLASPEVRFRVGVLLKMLKTEAVVLSPAEIGLDRTVVFNTVLAIAEDR